MIRASAFTLPIFVLANLVGCYHVAQLGRLVDSGNNTGAPALYRERCSHCHGESGRGDGLVGRSLVPPSRDFSSPAWQAATSDDQIRQVIRRGGEPLGLSARMPSHPDLSERDLDGLVSFIRDVGRQARGGVARRGLAR